MEKKFIIEFPCVMRAYRCTGTSKEGKPYSFLTVEVESENKKVQKCGIIHPDKDDAATQKLLGLIGFYEDDE